MMRLLSNLHWELRLLFLRKEFQDFLYIVDFNGSQGVEGLNCSLKALKVSTRSQPRNKGLNWRNN